MRLHLILSASITGAIFAATLGFAQAIACLNEDASDFCGNISMHQCMKAEISHGGNCEPDLRAGPAPRDGA